MAVSILSYQGNAGLGSGSNPQIPVLPNQNLDFINQTIRDISARDYDTNIKLYNQKIADRNQLMQMVLAGQVPPGDIDPKYRGEYDKARNKLEEVYTKYGGDIVNNPQGFREYANARNDLRDVVAHSQTNTIELEKLKQEAAKEPLPWKRKRIEDHYKKQYNKNFWDGIDPYQQVFDLDVDKMIGQPKQLSRTVPDPTDPLNEFQEQYFSYNDILKGQVKDFAEAGENWYNQNQWLERLQGYDPVQRQLTLDAMNKQLQKYNEERNLQPGMEDYAEAIQVVTAPNGQQFIQESVPSLAAKTALAAQSQFASRTPKFKKDAAKFQIDKERLALQARKLGIDAAKAGAYIRNLDAKTNKFVAQQQDEGTNISRMYEDFVNNMQPRGLIITQGGKKETRDVVFTDRLPGGFQYINGVIIDPKGKIQAGKLEPYREKGGRPYYINRYVDSRTGDDITPNSQFIQSTLNQWKAGGYKGSADDMMKTLLRNGALELVLQGKNGSANYTSMAQAAKAINVSASTKGEENIMNPPASYPDDDEPEPE